MMITFCPQHVFTHYLQKVDSGKEAKYVIHIAKMEDIITIIYNMDYYNTENEKFKIDFANNIFSSDKAFMELFSLVNSLFQGDNVFVIFDEALGWINIVETLIDILEERYGFVSNMALHEEDVFDLKDAWFNSEGLDFYDMDDQRYTVLQVRQQSNHPILKTILKPSTKVLVR